MALSVPLPAAGDTTWYDWATAMHDAVNSNLLNVRRVVHNGTAYPARPSSSIVAAGYVEFVGPDEPSDALDGDTWVQVT